MPAVHASSDHARLVCNAHADGAGSGVRDERLDGVEPLGDEAGDVAVAAVLADEADRVPQREVRLGRPRQRRVSGVQRPPRRRAGFRGDAGEFSRTRDLCTSDDIAEMAP